VPTDVSLRVSIGDGPTAELPSPPAARRSAIASRVAIALVAVVAAVVASGATLAVTAL